ncbi:MAG: hypothetical protein IH872_01870 [Chloroflexi bacterium]|nr:hypothetical protein [Chloroflexota bacterium]
MKLWRRKEDDFYITFLKFASETVSVGDGTINYAKVFEHVHGIHDGISEPAFKRIFLQSVVTIIFQGRETRDEDIENDTPLVLTTDAYFQLLEHQELQEARKASSMARNLALVAIAVAAASVILSVILPVYVNNDAVIDAAQYQGIIDAIQAE